MEPKKVFNLLTKLRKFDDDLTIVFKDNEPVYRPFEIFAYKKDSEYYDGYVCLFSEKYPKYKTVKEIRKQLTKYDLQRPLTIYSYFTGSDSEILEYKIYIVKGAKYSCGLTLPDEALDYEYTGRIDQKPCEWCKEYTECPYDTCHIPKKDWKKTMFPEYVLRKIADKDVVVIEVLKKKAIKYEKEV